jgi:hypothetical protein
MVTTSPHLNCQCLEAFSVQPVVSCCVFCADTEDGEDKAGAGDSTLKISEEHIKVPFQKEVE